MHVLQLLPSLEVGGVERGVLDLTKGLLARGHRVTVVSNGGALVELLTALGAAHVRMPIHEKSPLTVQSCLPAVTHLIRTTGVDLVHARSRVPAWIGFVAARRAQRPFVTTAHGFYRPHLASRVMVWGRLVIAPSEALGRYLIEQFRVPKDRLRVIPRGVDLEAFPFQPPAASHQGRWRIGLFGRVSRIKGHEVALEACARLIARARLPVTLCLAGDTPETPGRRRLDARIAELRLQEAVEWCGIRHELASLIASTDLVIVPSTYPESFGRAVIEAHAVGRPVIASRIGALEELIEDGISGLLVPPNDPTALAAAIGRLIHEPSLRQRCVEEGRKRVEGAWNLDRMVERTLEVYDECLTRPRVVIWKLSALGDVILSTPSLRAIRKQFPRSHVTLVVGRSAYDAVARCPYVDELLVYDPSRKERGLWRRAAFVQRLRQHGGDLSIDLQNSRSTHLMAWWAGIPVRVGFNRRLGRLLNRAVRLPRVVLAPIAHQQYLLRHAGIAPDGDALELWPAPHDDEQAAKLLASADAAGRLPATPDGGAQAGTLVGIHPGGSGRWKTKRWDITRWARLCDALAARGIRVVMTGGPEERVLGEALAALTTYPPLNAIGRTSLMELTCLITRCAAFVSHDSASLHVAAAAGTPTIALFGPTDPRRHLPPTFTGAVIRKAVFCSPCYSPRCRTITHACMRQISVEEVLQAVLVIMAEAERIDELESQNSKSQIPSIK